MQPIKISTPIKNTKTYNPNINFTAIGPRSLNTNDYLSIKAHKLLHCMNIHIERFWRDNPGIEHIPDIVAQNSKGEVLFIRPIYTSNSNENYLRLEYSVMEKSRTYTDIITISRTKPYTYKYERTISTPHGSATLKSYDSKSGHNINYEELISNKIEAFFPSIIEETYLKNFFGINYKESLDL